MAAVPGIARRTVRCRRPKPCARNGLSPSWGRARIPVGIKQNMHCIIESTTFCTKHHTSLGVVRLGEQADQLGHVLVGGWEGDGAAVVGALGRGAVEVGVVGVLEAGVAVHQEELLERRHVQHICLQVS